MPYKQGTNDENIRKQIQISWDNVPLKPKLSGTFGNLMCQMAQKRSLSRALVDPDQTAAVHSVCYRDILNGLVSISKQY